MPNLQPPISFCRSATLLLLLVSLVTTSCRTQDPSPVVDEALQGDSLRMDPLVRVGTLANGLSYYIRENERPSDRLELRLVVNAGSVLEDDDQLGLAHFVEHMAFNGTEEFPEQALVDYLESIGMRFGPEINAYTSFDETVYKLTVPTDSAAVVETAFSILQNWAARVSFDAEEIERERGVVVEEWRLRRGVRARMHDREYPVLLQGSRYPSRMPIGTYESITTFPHESLIRFYETWYRPDLMAIVAVGDIEADHVESLIHEHFQSLSSPRNPEPRSEYQVPDHRDQRFSIVADREASGSSVRVVYKRSASPSRTIEAFREDLVSGLYGGMLTRRLRERSQKPESPFLYAQAFTDRFVRTEEGFVLEAGVVDDGLLSGLEALLTEAQRAAQHGFTESELERQKADLMVLVRRAFDERNRTSSAAHAGAYVQHFLTGRPALGAQETLRLHEQLLPEITLYDVDRYARERIRGGSRVVLVRLPEKEGVIKPTREQLADVFERVETRPVAPFRDETVDRPLLEHQPVPGRIVDEDRLDSLGITRWTLSNGAEVVVMPTDHRQDQVVFEAQSPGGTSLAPDSIHTAAITAAGVVQESGAGAFGPAALRKRLAGEGVSVMPWLERLREGLSGTASPEDLETLLQLAHLYMTEPRSDSGAFAAMKNRLLGLFENRSSRPEAAFADTIRVTLAQYHPRERPWSTSLFREMDLESSLQFYRDRFGDASDFTFYFVGKVDTAALRPLVKRYLASLPAADRVESWRDVGIEPPRGIVQKTVERGQEPKGRTQITFTGPFEWEGERRLALGLMGDILELRLRQILREDLGGTYSVGVSASSSRFPEPSYRVTIRFGADPERLDELTGVVFAQIDSLKRSGVDDETLDRIKEQRLRSYETRLEDNRYWMSILRYTDFYGGSPTDVLRYPERLTSVKPDDVRSAAETYLDDQNFVQVSLVPEGGS